MGSHLVSIHDHLVENVGALFMTFDLLEETIPQLGKSICGDSFYFWVISLALTLETLEGEIVNMWYSSWKDWEKLMVPFGFESSEGKISVLTEQEHRHGEKNFFNNFSNVNPTFTIISLYFSSHIQYIFMEEATLLDTAQKNTALYTCKSEHTDIFYLFNTHTHMHAHAHSILFCTHFSLKPLRTELLVSLTCTDVPSDWTCRNGHTTRAQRPLQKVSPKKSSSLHSSVLILPLELKMLSCFRWLQKRFVTMCLFRTKCCPQSRKIL